MSAGLWVLSDVNSTTVGELKCKFRKRRKQVSTVPKKSRHVEFIPGDQYQVIRLGTPISEDELVTLFQTQELQESMLYIFQHTDVEVVRNPHIPKYEAAFLYKGSGIYIRAQKRHMEQIYQNANRPKVKEKLWEMCDDGTPYYVDRFAFSAQRK